MNSLNLLVALNLVVLCYFDSVMSEESGKNKTSFTVECNDESRIRADVCADKLWFIGKRARKMPENDVQLKKFCRQTPNLVKCVKDFTDKCGTGIQKQLANVMLYTVKANNKNFCAKTNHKRTEVLTIGPCANSIRVDTNTCMDKFLMALGIARTAELKFRIPHACCAFHELKTCTINSARNIGEPKCGDGSVNAFEKYITSLSGNTLNLMCSDYEEDSDKCTQLSPLPQDGTKKAKSIIMGFANILDSF